MKRLAITVVALNLFAAAEAQETKTGPAVTDFGEFYRIAEAVEVADAGAGVRAVFDIGVGVYLCGQSAAHRGFADQEIAEPVEVVLSAMTVLLQKQAEGYGMIAF